jgi:hypothetical protein
MNKTDLALAEKNLGDRWWRLNTLYHIVNKSGQKVLFSPNWAQRELYKDLWYCNIILKARQLGISTFVCLLFLDACIFNSNLTAGVIAHTKEDAEHLFKRIKFAYDCLPEPLKAARLATNDSARELRFNNGSSLRVGTSMRGATLQYLHVSEFGKICAKYPDKANEIITGSLNTIAPGQYVFIESTAEGREGHFFELCKKAQAQAAQQAELSKLDFKFHFFPWWKEPSYRIGSTIGVTQENLDYFTSLEGRGIKLDPEQKFWYAARASTQGDDMMREFPSMPEEAWESAIDGAYYAKHISHARVEKRIGFLPYDETALVHTAWDLGFNDSTAIWFFQIGGKEIHVIDYVEGSGESLSHWLGVVKSKPYIYEKHLAPHDILAHEFSSGMTRQASARKMGFSLIPVPRVEIIPGIDAVRGILNRCWFDEKKCSQGIKCLENYKKEWDDRYGCWRSSPLHNWASHGADAFRTLATGLNLVTAPKTVDARTLGHQHFIPMGMGFDSRQMRF